MRRGQVIDGCHWVGYLPSYIGSMEKYAEGCLIPRMVQVHESTAATRISEGSLYITTLRIARLFLADYFVRGTEGSCRESGVAVRPFRTFQTEQGATPLRFPGSREIGEAKSIPLYRACQKSNLVVRVKKSIWVVRFVLLYLCSLLRAFFPNYLSFLSRRFEKSLCLHSRAWLALSLYA